MTSILNITTVCTMAEVIRLNLTWTHNLFIK